MSRGNSGKSEVNQRDVQLEVAAKLLGKDTVSIQLLIQSGVLGAVLGADGDVMVPLAEVITMRHAWWQVITDIAIDLIAAFEDETLAAILAESAPSPEPRLKPTRKSSSTSNRRSLAAVGESMAQTGSKRDEKVAPL